MKKEGKRGIKAGSTYPVAVRCPRLAQKLSMFQCLIALRGSWMWLLGQAG